jgi:hypothetical protein
MWEKSSDRTKPDVLLGPDGGLALGSEPGGGHEMGTVRRAAVLVGSCSLLLGGCSDPESPDLPLEYSIAQDAAGVPEHVLLHTEGGPVKMLFTPWGSHAEPHTGHPIGDLKSNWIGLLWHDGTRSLLEELSGDGDGVCGSGELCGMSVAALGARIPRMISPADGLVVQTVELNRIEDPNGMYWGSRDHWVMRASLGPFRYAYWHAGWVGEDLRTLMLAQGDPDPATWEGGTGVNLLSRPIKLRKGDAVAIPQVAAREDPLYPGYVTGQPWAQMEITTDRADATEPVYGWLGAERQGELRTILWRQMQDDPTGFYTIAPQARWLWAGEADLWTHPRVTWDDYSSIFSHGGIWRDTVQGTPNDFAIWKILKDTPLYDPALYDSAEVSFLVFRGNEGGDFFRGEVISPGEVAAQAGTLLIKWRMQYTGAYGPTYQWLSYALDKKARRLKLHWGSEHADRAAALQEASPPNPSSLACTHPGVVCLNQGW